MVLERLGYGVEDLEFESWYGSAIDRKTVSVGLAVNGTFLESGKDEANEGEPPHLDLHCLPSSL